MGYSLYLMTAQRVVLPVPRRFDRRGTCRVSEAIA
jgi:hypothetical protein